MENTQNKLQISSDEQPKILVFLDVLGFQSSLQRLGHQAMLPLYEALLRFVDSQKGGLDIAPLPDGKVAVGWFFPEHAYFSDTILFWTQYDPVRLFRMTELSAEAVCKGIEIGLPLRSAITFVEVKFDSDRRVFFGAPLNEAATTEKAQCWIGVSFGPSIQVPPFSQELYLQTVLPYKSHIKPGAEKTVPGLVVDWPRRWRETRKEKVGDVLQNLDTDESGAEYYKSTLRFTEFSEKNHDWFRRGGHLDFG